MYNVTKTTFDYFPAEKAGMKGRKCFFFRRIFQWGDCAINVKVKMIYDGKDNDIISQYVVFTKVNDEQIKLYGRTREAVVNTINICKGRDVLKEYLL